jgi:hypothetical protein
MAETVIIHDINAHQHLGWTGPDGLPRKTGMIPRDFTKKPFGSLSFAKPFDIPLIPEVEWPERLAEQAAKKMRLSDIRNRGLFGKPIPSRDQNGKGYCWAHSGVSAALLARAINNQPFKDLSAYMVACIIKGFADEGGEGTEGVEFVASKGVATSATWPQQSMSRSNVNDAMYADAAENKWTEWMDCDPNQMWAIQVTCALLCIPLTVDYNWWSHSICQLDVVSLSPKTNLIWNSWGDSWSDNGTGQLTGSKATADNAMACRVMTAAA